MASRGTASIGLKHSTGGGVMYTTARGKRYYSSVSLKQTHDPKSINAKKWGEIFAAIGRLFIKRMDVTNTRVSDLSTHLHKSVASFNFKNFIQVVFRH